MRSATVQQAPTRIKRADTELAHALDLLLPNAHPDSLARMLAIGRPASFERRDRILREDGEPMIALLHAGYGGTWRSDPDGRTQLVALTGPGELAGLLSLGPHRRAVELVALTAGQATTWPSESVIDLARTDPGLAVDVLEEALHLSERLLTRLEHLGFDSVARRLARLMWHRREILFDARRPLLTRPQLADLAGATREMTDRVIRELERDGVVLRTGHSGLVLLDEEALRARAAPDQDERECS